MSKKSKQANGLGKILGLAAFAVALVAYLFFDIDLLGFGDALAPTAEPTQAVSTAPTQQTGERPALAEQLAIPFGSSDAPEYEGEPYVMIHGGEPYFLQEAEGVTEAFEVFSPLDHLGRCGTVFANVCRELMPTEKRGDIGHIKPTGWVSVRYDHVDGGSLYNRCHLLGFQLTGENDNERNLITGTRSMNTQGMLPFENMIADYVEETDNHVLYRVTPVYEGENLVASGVVMEAYSVEDQGEGVCFCVYAFNVEPGVEIDYRNGDSRATK